MIWRRGSSTPSAQKLADVHYRTRLEKLRQGMESRVESRRIKAEHELYEITDPRAVPTIARVFGSGGEEMQTVAVELLSQIDGPAASFWLTVLALEKPSPEVRDRASRAIARRDPRDVIGWLISMIHKPYKIEVTPASGPGTVGSLKVAGEKANRQRYYLFPESVWEPRFLPLLTPSFGLSSAGVRAGPPGSLSSTATNLNLVMSGIMVIDETVDSKQNTWFIQQQFNNDVRSFEEANAQIIESNQRGFPLLQSLTNQKMGIEPDDWQKWWADQLGYVYESTSEQDVPTFTDSVTVSFHHACFAAGTPVQTIAGPRKIESIKVGDRVLSQNATTGTLAFEPVLATHVNGPSATLRIAIDGETIIATGIHRFWKAGAGWTMAHDLKSGDRVRMIDGVVTIKSIAPDQNQLVYNLEVAENRDFLIGNKGLLVHDYGFVQPVLEPFDRQGSPAVEARK